MDYGFVAARLDDFRGQGQPQHGPVASNPKRRYRPPTTSREKAILMARLFLARLLRRLLVYQKASSA